jgi:hypothetical protein
MLKVNQTLKDVLNLESEENGVQLMLIQLIKDLPVNFVVH